jgi:hypothetical protein
VKEWLTNCLESHPLCQPPPSTPLPTRVIDVGDSDEDTKLYATQGENDRYAALSHCWGSHAPLLTTDATLKDRLKTLKFDSSSKTFAEAVNVTRRLGIRYLWIDSLCILQGNQEDWAIEGGKMSEIFRNATITLSADAAKDASEGLFANPDRRQDMHNSWQIAIPGIDGSLTTVYARSRAMHPSDPDKVSHATIVLGDTKLSTRAWVLQERLLSPRMLHFFPEELVWSCSTHTRCECRYQVGVSSPSIFRTRKASAEDQGQLIRDLVREFLIRDLAREWPKIVMQYTSKDITYTSDRLPAISGLARRMAEQIDRHYFAGLWEFDMSYGMLWFSDHKKAGTKPIERFSEHGDLNASWSWASVAGPVKYYDRSRNQFERKSGESEVEPLLDITRAQVTPSSANPYGSIKTAIVSVTGQIILVRYDRARAVWRPWHAGLSEPHLEPEVAFDVLTEAHEYLEGDWYGLHFLRAARFIHGGEVILSDSENICLLICELQRHEFPFRVFKRIGFVHNGFSTEDVWNSDAAPKQSFVML